MPLFNKVTGIQRLQKVTLTQVFLCEINEIFKNTCFEVHLRTVASDNNPVNVRLLANSILFCYLKPIDILKCYKEGITLLKDFS